MWKSRKERGIKNDDLPTSGHGTWVDISVVNRGGGVRKDASLSRRASKMSSVWDLLNLRCLMTSHIQGELFFNMSEAQGTIVDGYGVLAHDGNSCINLLFPSHCPTSVCTLLSLTRLAGAAPLLALLPLNSLPWSPLSEIQQREGSFQKQISSYHLLQKTLPQLPITFRIEFRPPGVAS